MKQCFIVGAAPIHNPVPCIPDDSFVIAADAGINYLNKINKTPDMIIGDFDSLGYIPEMENVKVFPSKKDFTDTILCTQEGLLHNCDTFIILGGLGGRIDHTLANIQTLAGLCTNGAIGFLCDGGNITTVIKNTSIVFPKELTGTLSVFSLSDKSTGVSISNTEYEVSDIELLSSFPLGVSNSFLENNANITVKNGMLAIMWNDTEFNAENYSIGKVGDK